MATAAVIDAFRRLDTNHARQDAIEALLRELTNHELRQLKTTTAASTFHCDIIGRLPVELVAHVFAYLDTSTPYRLQRVSTQWRHVLQSPVVVKQSLLRWYGPDLDLRQGGYTFFERKAKHLHAFRHGNPKLYLRINRDCFYTFTKPVLTEHTLAWKASPSDNILYLLDMQAWELFTLVGDARENVAHIFASSQIVGFSTSGTTVYASDLRGRGKKKFRVQNAIMTNSITCRESTVACAGFCEGYVLVFIWNYADQRGRSFTINLDSDFFAYPRLLTPHTNGLALILHPKVERITVFAEGLYFDSDTQRQAQSLRYSQYTYAGGHAFGTRVSDISACQFRESLATFAYKTFVPIDHRGTFRTSIANITDPAQIHWIQFDENVLRFTEPRPITYPGQLQAPDALYRWNDVSISKSSSPFPILTHLGSSDCPADKPLLVQSLDADGHSIESFVLSNILMNENYVVVMTKSGLHILCYETNPRHPTESGSFFNIGEVLEVTTPDI